MRSVAATVCRQLELEGGLLLHGGLIAIGDKGVLLAGRSGVGKTTATGRIPYPWRSLSDDATLVLPDGQGAFWAHPWPTWARLLEPEIQYSWQVQTPVPLTSVFFLAQAPSDTLQSLSPAHATCLLVQSASQVPSSMWILERSQHVRSQRLKVLDNITALTRALPCYELGVTLTGVFWELIHQTLT
jgi:SynChlorMet cassette protein ScmC